MSIISGIKITGNAKIKINYNKRTQIKAGRKIVKNTYEVNIQNEDDNEHDTYQ
jgi:ASC-1-like (ASCH) protein